MSLSNPNLPKLVVSLRQYSAQMFLHDLLAGITVGLVALPLAMAFGIASGVTPQAGLYTAVVAGFLISALGGSRTQIGGPTGAFVVIVAGIIARFGISGLESEWPPLRHHDEMPWFLTDDLQGPKL